MLLSRTGSKCGQAGESSSVKCQPLIGKPLSPDPMLIAGEGSTLIYKSGYPDFGVHPIYELC